MQEKPPTQIEKTFYSELPWTNDTADEKSATDNTIAEHHVKNKKTIKKNNWCNNISQFGIMYYVHQDEKTKFLNNLKNNIDVASVDYKFPENILDYVTLGDIQPTNDELAANYIIKQSGYNGLEELIKYVESTKNDLMNLSKLTTLRTTLRNLLFKERLYKKETVDKLKLLTNKDIEFTKQVEIFKTYIDDQQKNIFDVDQIKIHYLKLFNDLYFYVDNIKIILKKLHVSVSLFLNI